MERRFEAALMKPGPGATHGKLPLVLLVHGGPASNFSADYFWFNSSASGRQGYQDLMVNPRGSAGYGESFLKANRADWGGGDFKDLMAALDTVVARGETDPNRLGIGGWSYGGEMTQWAIMQTDRFRAAVTGGRVFDLAAEFGTEDSSAEMNGTSARPSSTRGSLRATHPPPTFVMQKHLRSSCTVRTIAVIPSAGRGWIALSNIMA
ncbi:MAG TPA: prolyl oligopeptidase family serine peptidase [Terriglobales bacterium]